MRSDARGGHSGGAATARRPIASRSRADDRMRMRALQRHDLHLVLRWTPSRARDCAPEPTGEAGRRFLSPPRCPRRRVPMHPRRRPGCAPLRQPGGRTGSPTRRSVVGTGRRMSAVGLARTSRSASARACWGVRFRARTHAAIRRPADLSALPVAAASGLRWDIRIDARLPKAPTAPK
jgi:hypothetical protein